MLKNIIAKKRKEAEIKSKKLATKKLATGAGIGILAGAVMGILMAPKSGKDTRETIANSAKDLNGNVKAKAVETKETLATKSKEAKCKISEYLNEKRKCSQETTNKTAYDDNTCPECEECIEENQCKDNQ